MLALLIIGALFFIVLGFLIGMICYKRSEEPKLPDAGLDALGRAIQQNLNQHLYTDAIFLHTGAKDRTLITIDEAEKIKSEINKNESRVYFASKRGNLCILYPENCKTITFRKCKVDSDNEEIA